MDLPSSVGCAEPRNNMNELDLLTHQDLYCACRQACHAVIIRGGISVPNFNHKSSANNNLIFKQKDH